jgi:hypothetical protein
MRLYIVRQGDYLERIAHALRFDADTVWNHPRNEDLRATRDPNVLAPGDALVVPDEPPAPAAFRVGEVNCFVAETPRVEVRLQLRAAGAPLAGARFVVRGTGETVHGATGPDGMVVVDVPTTVSFFSLVLPDLRLEYPVRVGYLDPVDTESGARARLTNLGYYVDPTLNGLQLDEGYEDDFLRFALESFQRAHDIPPSGIIDAATRETLLALHGS